ncbi:TetR/AcrR family transcriptional regulator [Paenibacillus sp. FJAT-26967]|uniref:TetR/AcrR family transcriptional regulator n=1 Tax=Paenibacillus sp. FJAT-26967 TaxID=1729690 RepID=UPI000837B613|nr:TetR/AcrR family transcriptional regulator [Paenibacillus sp. FJAT-26967]
MVVREDRKEQIIDKAVAIFAEKGYYKATTALVARAAGVTQPYVFHFFANKEELFKAVIDKSINRIYEGFMKAEGSGEQVLGKMAAAFDEVMASNRDEIVMVMQAHAISEPVIREHVREKFRLIHETIVANFEKGGVPDARNAASQFLATGLLLTVAEVLQLPEILCLPDISEYSANITNRK